MAKKQFKINLDGDNLLSPQSTNKESQYYNLEGQVQSGNLDVGSLYTGSTPISELNRLGVTDESQLAQLKSDHQSYLGKLTNSLVGGLGAGAFRIGENIAYLPNVVTQLF